MFNIQLRCGRRMLRDRFVSLIASAAAILAPTVILGQISASVESHGEAIQTAYRANATTTSEKHDLKRFLELTRARPVKSDRRIPDLATLSKDASSILDDMQLVPDQELGDAESYGAPDLMTLPGGVVGMVYTDRGVSGADFFGPPLVGPRVLFRTSADGGGTWSDPVVVADNGDFILDYLFVSIAAAPGGRLVIVDETPFEENHGFYSDDLGATWTEFSYEETNFLDRILGPVDGLFWVQAGEPGPQSSTIQYVASEDGVTWGDPQVMLAGLASDTFAELSSIVSTGGSSYLAALTVFGCCGPAIGFSRSSDNGATWSPIEIFETGAPESRAPRLSAGDGGVVHLTFVSATFANDHMDENVYTAMSTDGGATFSTPAPFTRFVGNDFNAAQAMAGPDPIIAFQSERGTIGFASRVWYGMGGANPTPDVDPPPVTTFAAHPRGWVPANRAVPAPPLTVRDEGSPVAAEYTLYRDGNETIVPLFDDGGHSDGVANDGIFGGSLESFPYGPEIEMLSRGIDDGGNIGYGPPHTASVAALHDVGNVVLAVTPEGGMGYEPLQEFPAFASFRFPKDGGHNYLSYAGLWVGINTGPGKRVSHLFYDNLFGPDRASPTFGDWQVTEYPTEAPGESALDVVMRYDDSGGPNPIGLEVKQTTYQWSEAGYVIFDYEITNESGGELADLFVAVALDPDMPVGGDPFDDRIGYDADRALLYAFDSGNSCAEQFPDLCTDVHAGVVLLSDGAETAGKVVPTPHTASQWSIFDGDEPSRNAQGLDVDMYNLMTEGIWPGFAQGLNSVTNEWRMVLTAQPFDLAPDETKRIVFGLVAGFGAEGLQATADGMIERFNAAVLAVERSDEVPAGFGLGQNYPNPFNPSTTVPFEVGATGPVSITVFDALGRQVGQIVNKTLTAGTYTATFDSGSLPSGAYYYTLTAGSQSITKSMFLLK